MITILCGKSSSGKDTLLKELVKENSFTPLISTTSRPMRVGERNGREYNFVSKDEFLDLIERGKMIEFRSYDTLVNHKPDTWYYGMPKTQLEREKDYVVILDLDGAKAFEDIYGIGNTFCVYIDVPDEQRTKWAKKRGSYDETEWNRRLEDDNLKFSPDRRKNICHCELQNNNGIKDLKADFFRSLVFYEKQIEKSVEYVYNDTDKIYMPTVDNSLYIEKKDIKIEEANNFNQLQDGWYSIGKLNDNSLLLCKDSPEGVWKNDFDFYVEYTYNEGTELIPLDMDWEYAEYLRDSVNDYKETLIKETGDKLLEER